MIAGAGVAHEDLVAPQGDGDGDQRFADAVAVVADAILPAEAGVVDVARKLFVRRDDQPLVLSASGMPKCGQRLCQARM